MLGRQSIKSEDCVYVIVQLHRPSSSAYASNFCLLVVDIPWDDLALMQQFRYGMRNDIKDLFVTFPEEPNSLTDIKIRTLDMTML